MRILAIGYNGPPWKIKDSDVPLNRPEKYDYFVHAEENCIISAARSGVSLKGATFYCTALPCTVCTRQIISVGAKKVLVGNVQAEMNNEKQDVIYSMCKQADIDLEILSVTNEKMIELLDKTIESIQKKGKSGIPCMISMEDTKK
jgi:deoxycytidylate deaminase